MIAEKLNKLAARKVRAKIGEVSVDFKKFIDNNNLLEDMCFISDVTDIDEDDLWCIYNNTDDCSINPYSFNLYYKIYYLLYKIDKNVLLKEIEENKHQWDDEEDECEHDCPTCPNRCENAVEDDVKDKLHEYVGSHASIKAIDKETGRVIETNAKSIEEASRQFVEKINSLLNPDSKIDVDEALKAKKVFDNDIKKQMESCQYDNPVRDKVINDYDKHVKNAQMELFGDTELLNNKTIGELRYYIFKNGWDKEFDTELLNHRESVLMFLYRKLQELTEEKMKKSNNITKEDMKNFEKSKAVADKEYKKQMDKVKEKTKDIKNPEIKVVSLDDIFDMFSQIFKR